MDHGASLRLGKFSHSPIPVLQRKYWLLNFNGIINDLHTGLSTVIYDVFKLILPRPTQEYNVLHNIINMSKTQINVLYRYMR